MIAVANAGYRAIAPDYSGYGLSDPPPDPDKASFLGFVNDIVAILDFLNIPKEPGQAEADFGRFDAKTVICPIYILFSRSEIPIAAENQEIMDMVDLSVPLPPWFTEEDLAVYGALYEKSGFQTALQVPYRWAMHKLLDIPDPKVEALSLLIMGQEDYVLKFPGIEDYIKSGEVKKFVPNLETIYLPQGSHFVHEQFPGQVNQLILTFLDSHVQSI